MSNGNISSPVQTTVKIKTYVNNLIDGIRKDNIILSQEEIIDIAALLDNVVKVSKKYVDELKKELDFKNKIELDGGIARVRRTESINTEIPPHLFYNEVSKEDFFRCVKVGKTIAKTVIPESRIRDISITLDPIKKISFQLKG